MKILSLTAGVAAVALFAVHAQAAGSSGPSGGSLWPTAQDKAICDPIFSRLQQSDRGMLMAQAELPKPAAEERSAKTSRARRN
ncbi:hypothetical protein N7E02_22350 [Aliirhizobium terrae]|uniref:hypothetical protein n=1 Tax=Terrirhizobium terrae TaxID=2926709 RepID=UPI002574FE8F|nr:hypothetical protein [Rhizobium sp. CC-CFT758]WJH39519.1 hypothetical protein N7E02_22350 [Rhizobium sp. CC-CFT758]